MSLVSREAKKLFAERVVAGITDRVHAECDTGELGDPSVLQAFILRAVVVVGGHVDACEAGLMDGHAECVEDELCGEVVAHRPVDDLAASGVLYGGEVEEPLAGLHVLDVGDPQLVGAHRVEAVLDEIRDGCTCGIAQRRLAALASAADALQA